MSRFSRGVLTKMLARIVWVLCVASVLMATDKGAGVVTLIKTEKSPITLSIMGQFQGSWMVTRRGRRIEAYRGIRYAEPPVNKLRFQPPKPILKYDKLVNASKDGPACPAHTFPGYPVDEDCLVINVYTPGRISSNLLPVIFFIHPGGFYSMSGRSDVAGPHYLLDRDLVLVTINYRLGSLGFLALGNKLAPGNNGFKDQVVALKWVQANIAAFRGDPDLVTIAGCSSGAVSVMMHMVSPMSKGLFHRGISLSGSGTGKVPLPSHRLDLAKKQARASKCPVNSTTTLFACLKTRSWKDIAGSVLKFFEFGYDPLSLWWPVVEPDFGQERFLVEEPMLSIRMGRFHSVPFIISQTSGEFFFKAYTLLKNKVLLEKVNKEWHRIAPISFILPRNETKDRLAALRTSYLGDKPVLNNTASARRLGKLYGDAVVGFPVHRMANLMCRHSSQPVYYSLFAYVGNHSHFEDPFTGKPVHQLAVHHDDLIYLFSLTYRFPLIRVNDAQDSKMVDKMTEMWYNFAKHGKPIPRVRSTPTSDSWPPMKPAMRNYLRIDQDFKVLQNLYEPRFEIWDELYPIQYS